MDKDNQANEQEHTKNQTPKVDKIKKGVVLIVKQSQVQDPGVKELVSKFFNTGSKGAAIIKKDVDCLEQITKLATLVSDKKIESPSIVYEIVDLGNSGDVLSFIKSKNGKMLVFDYRNRLIDDSFKDILEFYLKNENPTTICCMFIEDSIDADMNEKMLNLWTVDHNEETLSFIPDQSFKFLHDQKVEVVASDIRLLSFADKISKSSRAGSPFADPTKPTFSEIKDSEQKIIHLESVLRQIGYIAGLVKKYGC